MNLKINSIIYSLIIIFLIASGIVLSSCVEESALSDIDITDPSIITPEIKVSKMIDKDNNITSKIEVWLYDKNRNSIELKNGMVRLNEQEMLLKKKANDAPYYSGENIAEVVQLNTNYIFDIELSDGKIYTASIHTQDKELNDIILPSKYYKKNDLNISWTEVFPYDEIDIFLNRYFSTDTSGGQALTTIHMPSENIPSGNYTISKFYFNNPEGIHKTIISLIGIKNGTMDNRFNPDGEIISTISKAKEFYVFN